MRCPGLGLGSNGAAVAAHRVERMPVTPNALLYGDNLEWLPKVPTESVRPHRLLPVTRSSLRPRVSEGSSQLQ